MSNEHTIPPFHLAFPVHDLAAARHFYSGLLGCEEGRSSDDWVDFKLFGHQIVAHRVERHPGHNSSNPVDGHDVPVPHFGVVLDWQAWETLATRLEEANIEFVIAPCIRFARKVGEQATMFFLDPSGTALEFKAFRDTQELFRKSEEYY
jgi:extradiol dioxygenase family protein